MIYSNLLNALSEFPEIHKPGTQMYEYLKQSVRNDVTGSLGPKTDQTVAFDELDQIKFPYHEMGAVTTLDLFGLDELIIFSFYLKNRKKYRRVADIGANLGIHTIILSLCGFEVICFEPDPKHYAILIENIKRNKLQRVNPHQAAVSIEPGESKFIRVLGNTTGSHLKGVKESYGDVESFDVRLEAILPLFMENDFIKIDAEGHEKALLLATQREHWKGTDVMVEIGSIENRAAIFEHLMHLNIGMFPQKVGWNRAQKIDDLPTSHREGSLFLSERQKMPWK